MPQPSLPTDVESDLNALRSVFTRGWNSIQAQQASLLARWPGETKPVRLQMLKDTENFLIEQVLKLEDHLLDGIPGTIAKAYEIGGWGTALKLGTDATFGLPDLEAMSVLAKDTMTDVLAATQYVSGENRELIRSLGTRRINDAVVTGLTAEQAAVQLAADLRLADITSVVYKNGAKVGIETYTDMLVRTKTAVAYQEGGFAQGKLLGVTYWEIMDGPDCGLSYHGDPTLADGMIVGISVAEQFPISHPNCVRVTSPRPDIANYNDTKTAQRTSSEEQVKDQTEASRRRAADYARNPRKYSLQRATQKELSARSKEIGLPKLKTLSEAKQAKKLEIAAEKALQDAAEKAAQKLAAKKAAQAAKVAPKPVLSPSEAVSEFLAGSVTNSKMTAAIQSSSTTGKSAMQIFMQDGSLPNDAISAALNKWDKEVLPKLQKATVTESKTVKAAADKAAKAAQAKDLQQAKSFLSQKSASGGETHALLESIKKGTNPFDEYTLVTGKKADSFTTNLYNQWLSMPKASTGTPGATATAAGADDISALLAKKAAGQKLLNPDLIKIAKYQAKTNGTDPVFEWHQLTGKMPAKTVQKDLYKNTKSTTKPATPTPQYTQKATQGKLAQQQAQAVTKTSSAVTDEWIADRANWGKIGDFRSLTRTELPADQLEAVRAYTGSAYRSINTQLRSGGSDPWVKETVEKIDKVMNSAKSVTTRDAVVQRGIGFSDPGAMARAMGSSANVSRWEDFVGSVISDKGYVSTAHYTRQENPGFSGYVRLRIKVPKGSKGIEVSKVSMHAAEDEFILPRGTKFRVVSVTQKQYGVTMNVVVE